MDKVFLRLESVCKLPIVCSAWRKNKNSHFAWRHWYFERASWSLL